MRCPTQPAGGRIGLANRTPDGFTGQLFKTIGKHVPPPAGIESPALWGTAARIHELFAAQARLEADLMALMARYNRAEDGTMVAPSEYLEIVVTKR
ncbi:hypothetical protein [Methylibium sp.]|uniref:hypothetical protein n=1 Tax=Methylibium sp. TaxID=2067992 RepID=UPI003D0FEF61